MPAGICECVSTHSETLMPINAPKPHEMQPIDYADHTLEMDTRWMLADKPELKAQVKSSDAETDDEDPRVGADLTETQINELLHRRK